MLFVARAAVDAMTLPRASKKKLLSQFEGFHTHIHDFVWMLDWKSEGLPYCHLYVIGPKDGRPVKVGISVDGFKRVAGLQVGNWHELYVLKSAWFSAVADARLVEAAVHAQLRLKNMTGEWFDVDADEAFETVAFISKHRGVDIHQGFPDGKDEGVFDRISDRVCSEYAIGSEMLQEIRVAKLKKFGISKEANELLRFKGYEDTRPPPDINEPIRKRVKHYHYLIT